MSTLRGVGVLVTRPQQQALPLCRLLDAAGATTMALPAIEIESLPDATLAPRLQLLAPFDVVIFTSANAVRCGAAVLEPQHPGLAGPTLAAIGAATARALRAAGHQVSIVPTDAADSESLLAQPAFARPRGLRILLVKGRGGRDLLQSTLEQAGASLHVAEVYERRTAAPPATLLAQVESSCVAGRLHVVTATSGDVATALLQFAPAGLRRALEQLLWLVPSTRVGAVVRALGVSAPLLQANGAEDQELLSALVRWRAGAAGA